MSDKPSITMKGNVTVDAWNTIANIGVLKQQLQQAQAERDAANARAAERGTAITGLLSILEGTFCKEEICPCPTCKDCEYDRIVNHAKRALSSTDADAYRLWQAMQEVCEAGSDYIRVLRVEDDVREYEQGRPSFIDMGNSRQEAHEKLEQALAALREARGECVTRVVHCNLEPYDVYIGRPSKWGNPFTVGIDGTREEVIVKYRNWIFTQPHLMTSLDELRGKALGCWCKPLSCHGDVLVEMITHQDTEAKQP